MRSSAPARHPAISHKYLGEIINDTDSPVMDVRITITAKDSDGNIIKDVLYSEAVVYGRGGVEYKISGSD